MSNRISRKLLPKVSKLTLDYLYDPDRTGAFFWYPHDTPEAFRAVARRLEERECSCVSMATVLARQNRDFGAAPVTVKRAELLHDKRTLCLFTGQQAGLFGGPLYVCHKAITAICRARDLEKELDRPVLPVFWIAADDHDFAEVQSTGFPASVDGQSTVQRIVYEPDNLPDRLPMSELVLNGNIEDAVSAFRRGNIETEFSGSVFAALAEAYRPGRTIVEAFACWLTRLFTHLGLLVFNPADPEAKKLLVPLFSCELDEPDKSENALNDINFRLTEAGYHHQVSHPDGHTNLFYHHNGRHAIRRDGDKLYIDPEDQSYDTSVWLERLNEHPERFSSGVLFRPVVQSYWFPVVAAVLGPAEIAYWAQSRALFDRFNVCMPIALPRAGATILEPSTRKALDKIGLGPQEFFGDVEEVINRYFELSFPTGLSERFEEESKEIEHRLDDIKKDVIEFEPTLERTFEVAANKMRSEWDNLAKKTFQAHKRRGDQMRSKLYKLATSIYPERQPQERVFCVTYFLNKYGFSFIDTLESQLCTRTHDHQLIEPVPSPQPEPAPAA